MLRYLRRHLGVKLFLSYLLVVLVGIVALIISTEFSVPAAFDHHLRVMAEMMQSSQMVMDTGMDLEADLYTSYQNAVNEALTRASIVVLTAALAVSWFVTWQVTAPVQEMIRATRHIAAGHYEERVSTPHNLDDADELAQLAISFNRMAEQLAKTETVRRQLIGDISHELRTPLTTIRGSMEGLIDGILPPTPETFQEILRETRRLERLVANLQELSRVEAGSYTLKLAPLDLPRLVAAVARRLRPQFDEKGVALYLHLPENLPPALADADRISQVLINLMGNALQYTPPEGSVRVYCSLADTRHLQVTVEDTGIGIPVEHLPNLFTRFYRVDKSRSRAGGGSGIGLTIAKHLVEAHGGRIWAQSKGRGKGSAFIFTLPVAAS